MLEALLYGMICCHPPLRKVVGKIGYWNCVDSQNVQNYPQTGIHDHVLLYGKIIEKDICKNRQWKLAKHSGV